MNLLERLTDAERRAFLARRGRPLPQRLGPVRAFLGRRAGLQLIAEFKRSSPSHGDFPAQPLAGVLRSYESAGAAAVSILVAEEGFHGSLLDLRDASRLTRLPLLYKGFISHMGQVDEAFAYGADAVLLIAAVLQGELVAFVRKAAGLGLAPLVEVHTEQELHAALEAGPALLGINNRDLTSLACDLGVFLELGPKAVGKATLVAESGYRSMSDIRAAQNAGAQAVLIGEALLERHGALLHTWPELPAHVG